MRLPGRMTDHQAIWLDTQERVAGLARTLTDAQAAATVPACPDWTAKDLLAHMTGVDTDAWNGDVDDDFSDRWTDTHVRQRADASLAEVLAEWDGHREHADELFAQAPEALQGGMVVDASVHEQDFRGAIGQPGAKDQPGNRITLDVFADGFDGRVREHGLPALHVDAGAWQRTFGDGEAAVRVAVEEFEFQRALTGLRSAAQVRSWAWSDPLAAEQYEPVISGFGSLRDTDLVE
ncbi:maleylpyruvate isomerase family mycothiol-dependent enzyme [Actinomycetospora chiangmaiensis]|uniref:maleylpyruvate isomerase family mycothiol-dependent enzyme n=1 Tax=Actinomycetospora chiangmaiensis TaxID=402650 RepID=UPI00039AE8C9|nr:maleylpyruvate isomerase family mycothiol-dependent enzyme [Actinomycetospora chiangmaiensis]